MSLRVFRLRYYNIIEPAAKKIRVIPSGTLAGTRRAHAGRPVTGCRWEGLRSPACGGRTFEGRMPSLQQMRFRASFVFPSSTHSPTPSHTPPAVDPLPPPWGRDRVRGMLFNSSVHLPLWVAPWGLLQVHVPQRPEAAPRRQPARRSFPLTLPSPTEGRGRRTQRRQDAHGCAHVHA